MEVEAQWRQQRNQWLADRLAACGARTGLSTGLAVSGTLKRVVGLTLEAEGCRVQIGGRCRVEAGDGACTEAEVVGFAGDSVYLMATGQMRGLRPNARVIPLPGRDEVPTGPALLGRVLDAEGRPIDAGGRLQTDERRRLQGTRLNPLSRAPIDQPLDVGVRAVNGLLSIGRGQRIGLFAGSGVGKSTLLGMMTRHTRADVIVVGLIGERGREVRDFVQNTLGREGMKRAVVVATPADEPPLTRMRGAWQATAIAESFRDSGKHVLLLMDSLTRFAQAQREIGLAIGEPPTTRGYPPSVFTKVPQLIERAGNAEPGQGSITGIYTVLVEGDDPNDPVADTARAILDGHILLSRRIADAGQYPAIDIEGSVSRVASDIQSREQRERVRRLRQLYAIYREHQDLIAVGAYRAGTDPRVDEAVKYWPRIQEYLRQEVDEPADFDTSRRQLAELLAEAAA